MVLTVLAMAQALFGLAAAVAATPRSALPSPPACVAPTITARASVPAEDIAYLQKQANDYNACIKIYVDRLKAKIDLAQAEADADSKAANDAVNSANALQEKVKAFAERHARD